MIKYVEYIKEQRQVAELLVILFM